MLRPTPRSTLFPYTTLFRSTGGLLQLTGGTLNAGGAITTATYIQSGGTLSGSGNLTVSGPTTLDRKSTRLNSSHLGISYAVFCFKKKTLDTGRTLDVKTGAT